MNAENQKFNEKDNEMVQLKKIILKQTVRHRRLTFDVFLCFQWELIDVVAVTPFIRQSTPKKKELVHEAKVKSPLLIL